MKQLLCLRNQSNVIREEDLREALEKVMLGEKLDRNL